MYVCSVNYNSVQYCDYERNFVCIAKFLLVCFVYESQI